MHRSSLKNVVKINFPERSGLLWYVASSYRRNDDMKEFILAMLVKYIPAACWVLLFFLLQLNTHSVWGQNVHAQDKTVDRYGQLIHASFKAKVTSDEQLTKTAQGNKNYYKELKPTARDIYGGLLNSRQRLGLKATGFFHVQQLKNGRFVLVDPAGNAYFSLGVNGVGYSGDTYTHVKGRERIYEWLPGFTNKASDKDYTYRPAYLNHNSENFSFYVANRVRVSPSFHLDSFYNESVYRLRKWGFNSEGGFSNTPVNTNLNFPQVRFANLPEQYRISGSSLFDIYADNVTSEIYKRFNQQAIASQAGNPLIIGYFFGNEIDYHQFKNIIPAKKASEVATKKVLVHFLQDRYQTIKAFNESWETAYSAFTDMYESAVSVTTEKASEDMMLFLEIYLDKFYTTIIGEFRKFDKNHLILGDRYFTAVMNDPRLRQVISKVAARHLDVVSYNYYTYELDMERLKEMHRISGKPIMITEYHYGDPTQGQTSSIQMMDNEEQKGLAYRNYVENLAATGFVVGAHWFEYLDQAVTGRWFQGYNGEGFGIGLLNVTDQPYKQFLSAVMKTNYAIYDLALGYRKPFKYDFGPGKSGRNITNNITIFRTEKPVVIDGLLDAYWPKGDAIVLTEKERVMGIEQEATSATINLAYDDQFLYVFVQVKDPGPALNSFTGDGVWNGDAVEIFIGAEQPDKGGTIQVRDRQVVLAAGPDEKPRYHWFNGVLEQPGMPVVVKKDADDKGYVIEAALPLNDLNIKDVFKAKKIRFDIGFNNGDERQRNAQYMWNGVETNSQSREKWGILVFN
ncbi:MAG TPA: sugar-binding protein [Niabella sp.]|nr:sugar-binding protein [Niabella sp.]